MQDNEKLQISKELLELHACENKIKEEIIKFKHIWSNSQENEKYVLINKNWIEKYKQYYNYEHFIETQEIKPPSFIEDIFIINDLIPEFDDRPLDLKNEKKINMNCSLPRNFVLVSENFIKLVVKHFENSKAKGHTEKLIFDNLIYEVIIGGKCIIISDKHNKLSYFITLFKESDNNNKDNCYYYNTDSINFILRFEDKTKIEREFNLILSQGISNYITKRNLGSQSSVQKILNSKNELIGYFFNILFCYDNESTQLGLYCFCPKSKNNVKNENTFDSKTYTMRAKKSNEIKDIIDPHINSFLICLYQIEKLRREFKNIDNNQYTNTTKAFFDFFNNFSQYPFQSVNKFQNEMFNKIKFDNYQNLIQTIIEKTNS